MLLDALLFNPASPKEQSLNGICTLIGMQHGIRIAKQSLDERFNQQGIQFMEVLLEEAMKNLLLQEGVLQTFSGFNRVLIKDSSGFELPQSMVSSFPGKGGYTSNAAASIQFEFDLKRFALNRLALTPNTRNDHVESAETIDDIQPKDLVIRDLGYISMEFMREVMTRKAYFINRVSPQVILSEEGEEGVTLLNLAEIRRRLTKEAFVEVNVLIGDRKKMSCRAIFCSIPADKIAQRAKRQARKTERRGSKRTDKKVLERLDMNIFITNVAADQLSAQALYNAYRLRWQVELVFKAWKSHFKIDSLKKAKKERVHMTLLASLIWIVLSWSIISSLIRLAHQRADIHLSILKLAAMLAIQRAYLGNLVRNKNKLRQWLRRVIELALGNLHCEPRKGVLSSSEIIRLVA